MPVRIVLCLVAVLTVLNAVGATAHAQSTTASVSGRVTDPSKAVVADASIAIICTATNVRYVTRTNSIGDYVLTALPPGPYRIEIETPGFRKLVKPDVILHVLDVLVLDFELLVGSVSDRVVVEAGTPLLQTSNAAVSTLVDDRFVQNMPSNGRSFSSLINVTPGTSLVPTNFFEQGQFSVNGQRPDANYFMVDGVSANLGSPTGNFVQGGGGQVPATSAFGGMSNLVSLDALQEFRIQTSTFAPEFGRAPGAQVSVVTKSGGNIVHGTAFEYLRHDALDANNWFANAAGLPEPALRQNDFGGVLGGPLKKNTAFFFGSYEGVRLRQPRIATTYVPSLTTRQSAPAAVQPLLAAFPKPTGADLGDGTASFSAGYSDPSSLDAYSFRADYVLPRRGSVFGRFSNSPSSLVERAGGRFHTAYSDLLHTKASTQTTTVGANIVISRHAINDLRFNYSLSRGESFLTMDDFGGAVAPADSVLVPAGHSLDDTFIAFFGDFNPFGLAYYAGRLANNLQRQINVVDSASWIAGAHQLKFGLDYRRLNPQQGGLVYLLEYEFGSLANVTSNSVPMAFISSRSTGVQMDMSNWSVFAQDTWNLARDLTVTYGLRWEYNTAPTSSNSPPYTVNQVDDLATMRLASAGTPLWHPQRDDFAPRIGVAWEVRPTMVVRGGGGIFYDLGYADIANAMVSFPYVQQKIVPETAFPLTAAAAAPPGFTTAPPAVVMAVVDPAHVLPRTHEWNVSVERTFGRSEVVTLTYLGAAGRQLMRKDVYLAPNADFSGEFDVLSNGARSSYDAFQAQYRHRLSRGFQALVSYTWGRAFDDVSSDVNYQNVPSRSSSSSEWGPSDYDVRHTFAGVVSCDIPGPRAGPLKEILAGWSTDSIVYIRSAPAVNVVTGDNPFGGVLSGASSVQRPDLVPGVPLYLDQPNAPGGRVINSAAFTAPAAAQGNLGRNALRGFGATQWDLTVRRQFRLTGRIGVQARIESFNILNHPNFGSPINYLTSPQFGQSTQMLASYLGGGGQGGGLSPLYQIGGPRSIQLAARFQF